ncbi:3,4-dihydroxy-2-butanone-4-phosphate synthase [Caldicellulosiruptor morganii]|uniref:GTP cyclohydrolase-2 n=1 Tax=Caldicellulosiruptor morganii TaxID=1387555 RepID=A0ABY7BPR3_9FIRM|nr:3,4-dihydroxy-2-butanone-4-phosphate synthase [Caldicellulosiruptor morganii]WAM34312.1 3,4-dihydroxy-2-butanone-4-phosphate synthase [Caldicellulosiruptor morganii]
MKEIIERLKRGDFVIVFDSKKREDEADLILPAQFSTPQKVSFTLNYARGMFCVAINPDVQKRLNLYVPYNIQNSCTFTVTVDHKDTKTGISAEERSKTVKELANPFSLPSDFKTPGHVSPVVAKEGGVLERKGHTEAAIDLCKLSELFPAALMIEILDENGDSHNKEYVKDLAKRFDIPVTTIEEIEKYILLSKIVITKEAEADLPTEYGHFKIFAFKNPYTQKEHAVVVNKSFNPGGIVNVRIHSSCRTGDIFHSLRCDCHQQLEFFMEYMAGNKNCMLIYLDQEGRGIGFANKIRAYSLQEQGFDTYEANNILGFEDDLRDYFDAIQILKYFGITKINLATSNPEKISSLSEAGIEVVNQINIPIKLNIYNKNYIYSKITKKGHKIGVKGVDKVENL